MSLKQCSEYILYLLNSLLRLQFKNSLFVRAVIVTDVFIKVAFVDLLKILFVVILDLFIIWSFLNIVLKKLIFECASLVSIKI